MSTSTTNNNTTPLPVIQGGVYKPVQSGGQLPKIPFLKQEFPGEKHAPLVDSTGTIRLAQYAGPGTHVLERVERGDRGLTPVDVISRLHDEEYIMASTPDQIRAADVNMIQRIDRLAGRDSTFNTAPARAAINAKMKLENVGVDPETFTGFGHSGYTAQSYGEILWDHHQALNDYNNILRPPAPVPVPDIAMPVDSAGSNGNLNDKLTVPSLPVVNPPQDTKPPVVEVSKPPDTSNTNNTDPLHLGKLIKDAEGNYWADIDTPLNMVIDGKSVTINPSKNRTESPDVVETETVSYGPKPPDFENLLLDSYGIYFADNLKAPQKAVLDNQNVTVYPSYLRQPSLVEQYPLGPNDNTDKIDEVLGKYYSDVEKPVYMSLDGKGVLVYPRSLKPSGMDLTLKGIKSGANLVTTGGAVILATDLALTAAGVLLGQPEVSALGAAGAIAEISAEAAELSAEGAELVEAGVDATEVGADIAEAGADELNIEEMDAMLNEYEAQYGAIPDVTESAELQEDIDAVAEVDQEMQQVSESVGDLNQLHNVVGLDELTGTGMATEVAESANVGSNAIATGTQATGQSISVLNKTRTALQRYQDFAKAYKVVKWGTAAVVTGEGINILADKNVSKKRKLELAYGVSRAALNR